MVQSKIMVIVQDEAHLLYSLERHKRQDLGEPPGEEIVRRFRKRGFAFFIVNQTFSSLGAALTSNLGALLLFPLRNRACLQGAAMAAGLSREQADVLSTLPHRHAIYQGPPLGRPVLLRIPERELPEGPDEEEIKMEMQAIIASLPCSQVGQDRQEVRERMESTAVQGEEKDEKGAGEEGKKPQPARENGLVTEELRNVLRSPVSQETSLKDLEYLRRWNMWPNQFLPLSVFDEKYRDELGLCAAKGTATRGRLESEGLIKVETIQTGKWGAPIKTVRILKKGYNVLKLMHVRPNVPKGRGSFAARFWAVAICRYHVKKVPGSTPKLEGWKGGKCADVAVGMPDGTLWAFEICMSPAWVSQNLVKDALGGFDRVCFCALKEAELSAIRAKVERELGDGELARAMVQKAEYRLLKEFLP